MEPLNPGTPCMELHGITSADIFDKKIVDKYIE